ncbi:MAG: cupin domain-containing protein [Planktomarina sp.]
MQNIRAEIQLGTTDLQGDIGFFTKTLGFRMEEIFPADDPAVVTLQGYGLRLRLDVQAQVQSGIVRILCDDPVLIAGGETALHSPGGIVVEIVPLKPPVIMPETTSEFVVRRLTDQAPWVVGRAGMHYRDLIPSRLGGSIIASHIRIPDGGPVPDMVHFHSIGFQLIYCYKGWVDLVYEGQGKPFRLHAGNCVIQPPEIRHRVLYASDNIEVIEIGVPADHVTTIDHTMELPTPDYTPDREWADQQGNGQRFVHNQAQDAVWTDHRIAGVIARDTTINTNTKGVAGVQVLRPQGDTDWTHHTAPIHFTFVLNGTMTLHGEGQNPTPLSAGDAFVIPPAMRTKYMKASNDLELLEVTLPALP